MLLGGKLAAGKRGNIPGAEGMAYAWHPSCLPCFALCLAADFAPLMGAKRVLLLDLREESLLTLTLHSLMLGLCFPFKHKILQGP